MAHTSVYQDRKPKPTMNLEEALQHLKASVSQRARDQLAKRYPRKGSERTQRITRRILGERD